MTDSFTVIIPARIASTRLPGKVLLDIDGKPLIQHVYESAISSMANQVYIAADDQKIIEVAEGFGARCILTSQEHCSGTDRIAEAVTLLEIPQSEIIVNVQGDEFDLSPGIINQVANLLSRNPEYSMATLYEKIHNDKDLNNQDIVKVVVSHSGAALYFSRLPIPCNRNNIITVYKRHIGIYAYRADYLQRFTNLSACELETVESLEQLRALYYGTAILVEKTCEQTGISIDTEEDLLLARQSIKQG